MDDGIHVPKPVHLFSQIARFIGAAEVADHDATRQRSHILQRGGPLLGAGMEDVANDRRTGASMKIGTSTIAAVQPNILPNIR